jgi:hypothetical protein
VAIADLWALEMLLAAFAGGAFGAAIGALPAFSLAGLLVILGELYTLTGRTLGVEPLPVDITGSIGFGVVLGPHVAFGGGAAALAYATKRGYLDSDFEYHQAKDITRGLGSNPDVLAVGGYLGSSATGLRPSRAHSRHQSIRLPSVSSGRRSPIGSCSAIASSAPSPASGST